MVAALVVASAAVAVPTVLIAGQDHRPSRVPTNQPSDARASGDFFRFRLPIFAGNRSDPNSLNLAKPSASSDSLLLFLPATGERPVDYEEFLHTAYAAGFSVLGLDYWNIGRSVTKTCLAVAKCYTELQQNRFNGSDPSRFSKIDAENSVLDRLDDALDYLEKTDPDGRWQRFRTNGAIDWNDIVVAGHSQGGGESAYIGHLYQVQGVLTFSSPVETYEDVSASLMDRPGATPASRMYGFDDIHDIYADRIMPTWRKLGMGRVGPADAVAVPTGSHTLLSSLHLGDPVQTHGRSVNDRTPRTASGAPVFAPTWRWMLQQVAEKPPLPE